VLKGNSAVRNLIKTLYCIPVVQHWKRLEIEDGLRLSRVLHGKSKTISGSATMPDDG
jgi:hypothetical protein